MWSGGGSKGPQQVGMSRLYTQQTFRGQEGNPGLDPQSSRDEVSPPLRQGPHFESTLRPSPQVSGAPERAPECPRQPLALDT